MKRGLFGFGTPMLSRQNSGISTPVEGEVNDGRRAPSIQVDKVETESLYAIASERPKCAPRSERDTIIAKLFTELESLTSIPTTPPNHPLLGCTYTARSTLSSHLINLHLIPQIINDYPASRAGDMFTKIGNVNTAYAKWPTLEQNLNSEGAKERILKAVSLDMHEEMMGALEGVDEVCGTFWGKAGLVKAGYAAMRAGPGDLVFAPDEILGVRGVEMRRRCVEELERLEKLEWEMKFGVWRDYDVKEEGELDPVDWMESQKQLRYADIARISNRNHTVELVRKCMGERDVVEAEEEKGGDLLDVVEKAVQAGRISHNRSLAAH